MAYYDSSRSPELSRFKQNLESFDGGRKSTREASQICQDLSKYLAFCNDKELQLRYLLDVDRLRQFVNLMEESRIGPDGICTKIDRRQVAIRYLVRDVTKFKSMGVEALEVIDRLSIWKSLYRKEKNEEAAHESC